MIKRGRINAALAVLLNSDSGQKIFTLDGSLKGRIEGGVQKLKVWDPEAVKKITDYFRDKWGIPTDESLRIMKTWRKSKVKENYRKNKLKNNLK